MAVALPVPVDVLVPDAVCPLEHVAVEVPDCVEVAPVDQVLVSVGVIVPVAVALAV